jgi:hypothetical protein
LPLSLNMTNLISFKWPKKGSKPWIFLQSYKNPTRKSFTIIGTLEALHKLYIFTNVERNFNIFLKEIFCEGKVNNIMEYYWIFKFLKWNLQNQLIIQ